MSGYRYDTETGLYYLNSRYYNPEWGRFINADALGGQVGSLLSHNVFIYCQNNAVNMGDPSGFMMVCITDGGSGKSSPKSSYSKAIFGASFTKVVEADAGAEIPAWLPIRAKAGTKKTTEIMKKGNSTNKIINCYAKTVNEDPRKASAGYNINIGNSFINYSYGLSDTGVSVGFSYKNTTYSLELSGNISKFNICLIGSCETQMNSKSSYTSYGGVIIDGWVLAPVIVLAGSGGTYVPAPVGN